MTNIDAMLYRVSTKFIEVREYSVSLPIRLNNQMEGRIGGLYTVNNIKCLIQGCILCNMDIYITDMCNNTRKVWYRHCTVCGQCILWEIQKWVL